MLVKVVGVFTLACVFIWSCHRSMKMVKCSSCTQCLFSFYFVADDVQRSHCSRGVVWWKQSTAIEYSFVTCGFHYGNKQSRDSACKHFVVCKKCVGKMLVAYVNVASKYTFTVLYIRGSKILHTWALIWKRYCILLYI